MRSFEKVIGIDVAKESLAVSVYDGKVHTVIEMDYSQKEIRKILTGWAVSSSYNINGYFLSDKQ